MLPRLQEKSFHSDIKDDVRQYMDQVLENPGESTGFLFDYKVPFHVMTENLIILDFVPVEQLLSLTPCS